MCIVILVIVLIVPFMELKQRSVIVKGKLINVLIVPFMELKHAH